jgi:hypothetical protein
MTRSIVLLMRIVFLLMLFQLAAPAVLTVTTQDFTNAQERITRLTSEKSTVVLLILLKEKEENECEDLHTQITFTPLLNFTDHICALILLHTQKHTHFLTADKTHPKNLITMLCSFII